MLILLAVIFLGVSLYGAGRLAHDGLKGCGIEQATKIFLGLVVVVVLFAVLPDSAHEVPNWIGQEEGQTVVEHNEEQKQRKIEEEERKAGEVELSAGKYVVGEIIEAGEYTIRPDGTDTGNLSIHAEGGKLKTNEILGDGDQALLAIQVDLDRGDIIAIDGIDVIVAPIE